MFHLLAEREGGLMPLNRFLRKAGVRGLWAGRLRALLKGHDVPAWAVLAGIARTAGIMDVAAVHSDWEERYRRQLKAICGSPLGIELRVLIAESARTLRAFSPRLGFNYSVLVRDLQRIDYDLPIKWYHVERILRAAGLAPDTDRWREIHMLWYTAADRRGRTPTPRPQPVSAIS
jgi:hypothetical protein